MSTVSRFLRELPSTVRPVSAAELVRRGHSKHVLDGPRWRRTTRGFDVPAGTSSTPTQRVVEGAAVAPVGAVLGGWAAAFALGSDLLDGLDDHTTRPIPVSVILPPRLHRASVPGIFDRAGRFLGVPDLLDVDAGLVLEYDGGSWNSTRTPGGHRDRDQHREDNAREELFERAGLLVVRADKGDLSRYRRRLRDRLTAARCDGLRRDRSRDGWTLQPPDHGYGMPA